MAMLGSKRIHYALTDSRGKGVMELIEGRGDLGECFDLQICEGATLGDLTDYAIEYLAKHPFDVIYLAGGACDITYKDKRTKQIFYAWGKGNELSAHLSTTLTDADERIKKEFPAS